MSFFNECIRCASFLWPFPLVSPKKFKNKDTQLTWTFFVHSQVQQKAKVDKGVQPPQLEFTRGHSPLKEGFLHVFWTSNFLED